MSCDSPQILISAGEASGDLHAALLVEALRARTGAHFFGMGGPRMRGTGVEIIVDCRQVAVFGLWEAWMRIPAVLRSLRRLEDEARRRKPALAILVDSSGIHLRLAKRLSRQGIRLVYFIGPQVWAWRRYRVRAIRRLFEKVLVIFPFEESFYRNEKIPATFTGNPLVDEVHATQSRAEFAAHHGLDVSRPIITVLPGSRRSELNHHFPVLAETLRNLAADPKLQFVVASAPGFSREAFAQLFSSGVPFQLAIDETYNALAAADCAIVSSGTATVEAALLGTPMVVIYRLSTFTAALARMMVQTRTFAMVNLIAERKIVPELIQGDFTPDRVAVEVRRLLHNPEARRQMKTELEEIRSKLGASGATERAADAIARLLADIPRGNPAKDLPL